MAAVTAFADTDTYRQDFEALTARRCEPDNLLSLRRTALKRFESLGLPSSRQEAWRFTDISALAQIPFRRAGDTPVDAARLPVLKGPHHRLVFVNGRFAPRLSRLQAMPDEVLIASLGQALLTHPEQVVSYLDRLEGLEDNPFTARNSAFWEDGAFIYLPRDVVLEQPLHLVCFAIGDDTASHPRSLIILEDTAQATLVADYQGEGRYLHCPVTEIQLGAGAVLSYHLLQEEDPQAWHLGGVRLRQEQDSHFSGHLLSAGGLLTRTDLYALLAGEGAECYLNGLTLVKDKQLSDQHIRVEHARPRGTSRQLFKSILEDKGHAVFDGMIHVHKQAQKTDASQQNHNLLLSRQALANSNPRLEILADDVKCSHGSTTGFLDLDALFYLRSRGIGQADAQAMLVYAFANEIVEHIRLAPLRERLEGLLSERLYPAAAAERNP
jgi:Fe-S cluster assembly protein SufD